MGADDDVRTLADLRRVLELLAHVGCDLDLDRDAVLGRELVGVLLHGHGAVWVGPDDEVDVGVTNRSSGATRGLGHAGRRGGRARGAGCGVGRGGGAGPTAGAEGQGGNTRDSSSAEGTLVHGFSFEARWHTPPPVPRNLAR